MQKYYHLVTKRSKCSYLKIQTLCNVIQSYFGKYLELGKEKQALRGQLKVKPTANMLEWCNI